MIRRISNAPPSLLEKFALYFHNDTMKFLKATHLEVTDLYRKFTDPKTSIEWKIMGAMEGKEIICQNLTDNSFFSWDRWKVSCIMYPEKHAQWDIVETQRLAVERVQQLGAEAKSRKKAAKKAGSVIVSVASTFEPETVTLDEEETSEVDPTLFEIADEE